jgi:hypothetical protein
MQGYGTVAIARQLGLNRHTIARWKRDPRFIAEVEALRQRATELALANKKVARNAPRRLPPAAMTMTDNASSAARRRSEAEDDRECEAMIADLLTRHVRPRG